MRALLRHRGDRRAHQAALGERVALVEAGLSPALAVGPIRQGVEREMRRAHRQALARPR